MQVFVSSHDVETAQRVRVALEPLCRELTRRHEQSQCRLQVAPGLLVAEFHARDGTAAQIPVGVKPLAAACVSGRDTLRKYVDLMIRKARDKQERARLRTCTGLILPN